MVAALAAVIASACVTPNPEDVAARERAATSPVPTRPPAPTQPESPPATPSPVGSERCGTVEGRQPPGPVGQAPAYLRELEGQVEALRGLRYTRPVAAEPVTKERMAELVREEYGEGFPRAMLDRRGRAWAAMGVIPPDTNLPQTIVDMNASDTAGFYQPSNRRLVFVGSSSPSPLARYFLSHELTHALDDQHFDLTLVERLSAACRDEAADAYQALVEGDATAVSAGWITSYLSIVDQIRLGFQSGLEAGGSGGGAPTFVSELAVFPYLSGETFVRALRARGGERMVDQAFEHPPVSTEQILHPDRYPGDLPEAVDVPDLASRLGQSWRPLDRSDAGEEFLRAMLALRRPQAEAEGAAAGWGGGAYRSWTDGAGVAVLLATAWDTPADASAFQAALTRWIGALPTAFVATGGEGVVYAGFASDPGSFARLRTAFAAAGIG
jgi:hypothetical protein